MEAYSLLLAPKWFGGHHLGKEVQAGRYKQGIAVDQNPVANRKTEMGR